MRPTNQAPSRTPGEPPSLPPGRGAVHPGASLAPHHGQPSAGRRELAQGGGRCLAPSLAEHDADLRQTRQQKSGGSPVALAGVRSMSMSTTPTTMQSHADNDLNKGRQLGFGLANTDYAIKKL